MRIAIRSALGELDAVDRALLFERRAADEPELRARVARLLDEVRVEGDAALLRMARELDGVELDALEVPREQWAPALDRLAPAVRSALERARRNIETFHRAQRPAEIVVDTEPGVRLGRRAVPLASVGVYAPGGRAAYPSSVLMGVVPARAAGVEAVIVCSPPGPTGRPPDEVLAACTLTGASRLFAVGGAGAVGALAFGTATVPRVQAIVGPGNRWVTEAKRQVAGELRVDAPAGPSEVLVVAAPGADPGRIADELLAQAEHDPDAFAVAVTWDPALGDRIAAALASRLADTPRRGVAQEALAARGALLVAGSREEALAFADELAAEHLLLMTDDPRTDLRTQTSAGTVFLGESSSVAFGDYLTGANHVLPTGGRARSFGGLSVLDFVRFQTWQEVSRAGAAALATDTTILADAEGLFAHAAAARAAASPRTSAPAPRSGEGDSR